MTQTNELVLRIRMGLPDDLNLILNSWLLENYHAAASKYIPKTIYFDNQKNIILKILSRSSVYVACNPEDETQIYGYLVVETLQNGTFYFHWLYVKTAVSEMGVATTLVRQVVPNFLMPDTPRILCLHVGKLPKLGLMKKFNVVYNPYILHIMHYGANI